MKNNLRVKKILINSCKGSWKGNNIDFGDHCLCVSRHVLFLERCFLFLLHYTMSMTFVLINISRLIQLRYRVRSKPLAKISEFLNFELIEVFILSLATRLHV